MKLESRNYVAGLNTEEDFKLYIDVVKMNYGGYFILLTRDVEEVFVESYNPEWTLAWNRNTDIQLCLYFFCSYNISQNIIRIMKQGQWIC